MFRSLNVGSRSLASILDGSSRRLLVTMVILVLLLMQGARATEANPGTTIDSFATSQSLSAVEDGTAATTGTDQGVVDGTGILGGERDVVVTITDGTGFLDVDIGSGQLQHSQTSPVKGTTLVTYDGNDNDASNLDPNGLGTVDLSADQAFLIELTNNDQAADLTIAVYSNDASHCSSLTKTTPGGLTASDPPVAMIFRFSDFTAACSSSASFADVGAITLLIDGTLNSATDLTMSRFETVTLDFGDLPETTGTTNYPGFTTLPTGAHHVIGNLKLGALIDSESDGQPDADAGGPASAPTGGDDGNGVDDEDGVVRTPAVLWQPGSTVSVDVTITGGDACLSAWIDWNNDGDFADTYTSGATDHVMSKQAVSASATAQTFSFLMPSQADLPGIGKSFYARFRLFPRDSNGACTDALDSPTGAASNGEVEDYFWEFGPTTVTLTRLAATSAAGFPAGLTLATLAFLAGTVAVGGVLVRRRRDR